MARLSDKFQRLLTPGPQRTDVLVCLAMVMVFLVFVGLSRHERHPARQGADPEAIQSLSARISSVDELDGGDTLEIVLNQDPTYMASIFAELGREAVFITRGLQREFPRLAASTVRFVAWRRGKGIERIMLVDRRVAVEFQTADLMRLELTPNYAFQNLLNLSRRVIYESRDDLVVAAAFCDDQVAIPAAAFCRRELSRRLR